MPPKVKKKTPKQLLLEAEAALVALRAEKDAREVELATTISRLAATVTQCKELIVSQQRQLESDLNAREKQLRMELSATRARVRELEEEAARSAVAVACADGATAELATLRRTVAEVIGSREVAERGHAVEKAAYANSLAQVRARLEDVFKESLRKEIELERRRVLNEIGSDTAAGMLELAHLRKTVAQGTRELAGVINIAEARDVEITRLRTAVKRANLKFVEVTNRQHQEIELLRAKLEISAPRSRKKLDESAATRGATSAPADVDAVAVELSAELKAAEGASGTADDILEVSPSSVVSESVSATGVAAASAVVSPSAQISSPTLVDVRGSGAAAVVDATVDAASIPLSNAFSKSLLYSSGDVSRTIAADVASPQSQASTASSAESVGETASAPRPSSAARYERPTSAAVKRALSPPPHPVFAEATAALELLSEETAALSVDDDDGTTTTSIARSAASPLIEMPVTSLTAAHNIAALLLQELQASPVLTPTPSAAPPSFFNNLLPTDTRAGSANRPGTAVAVRANARAGSVTAGTRPGSASASSNQSNSRIYKADRPLVAIRDEIARASEPAAASTLQSGNSPAASNAPFIKARWKSLAPSASAPAPAMALISSPMKKPLPFPGGLVIVGKSTNSK